MVVIKGEEENEYWVTWCVKLPRRPRTEEGADGGVEHGGAEDQEGQPPEARLFVVLAGCVCVG